jgi:hypothetical protein
VSKEIIIGGRLVKVPKGYIQAEAEFTKDEIATFNALSEGIKKEEARLAVMSKRLEFHALYEAGKVELEAPKPAAKKDMFTRFVEWFDD